MNLRFITLSFVILSGCASPALAQFETRSSTPTLQSPYSIALGDFNHDGKIDMAVAAIQNTQISVYLGKGDGTFQPPVNYQVGIAPGSVTTADLNGDGNLDLAVAGAFGVAILLGQGDGTFRVTASYPITNYPSQVAVADLNNDHKLDLVVVDYPALKVMLGNGDGSFQSPITLKLPDGPITLAIGDFNHDGNLDLAVAEPVAQVQIFLGKGDGTFQPDGIYGVDESPSSIAVGDFRGNGVPDLAIACDLGVGVAVLLGNGDGSFQPQVTYPLPQAKWVTTADLDGDGKLDLAVANFSLVTVPLTVTSVLRGNGDGTFQNPVNYISGREDTNVAIGDFNGDGMPDMAVADYFSDDVLVLLNTGVASFSPTTPLVYPPQLLNTTSGSKMVTLTNSGTAPLTISSVTAQGEFKVSDNCGKSVKAGAKCTITVHSAPTTEGTLTGTVTIRDSASSEPQVIELSGAGTVVELAPTSLSFGTQSVHTKGAPQQVELSNTGSAALTINVVALENGNWTSFSQSNNCGSSVPAGGTCTITVTFDPTKKGSLTSDLDVYDSGGGTYQRVTLSGTGD